MKKLNLNKETLKQLQEQEGAAVQGATRPRTFYCSDVFCRTDFCNPSRYC